MQLKVTPITREECSTEEWQARVDLAAAHRIAVLHGFNEGIFNHLTYVVPRKPDRYYQIPFGMHWSEVKASSFMEVGIDDGRVKRGAGDVERSCYCIHAPIHKALLQAKAVFHTHMPYASALTRLEDPRIKEIGQTEVGMIGEIAYDDEYTGPAFDTSEGKRLAGILGEQVLEQERHTGKWAVGRWPTGQRVDGLANHRVQGRIDFGGCGGGQFGQLPWRDLSAAHQCGQTQGVVVAIFGEVHGLFEVLTGMALLAG